MLRVTCALAFTLALACWSTPASAQRKVFGEGFAPARTELPEPTARDIVVAYNTGLRFSLAPGVLVPFDRGGVGFSITGDVRYGFELGYVILAPGLRLAGYFPTELTALAALATTRVTFPLGPVGPYLMGGLGPGYTSNPDEVGLAYTFGGGLMVHFGTRFGLGAEATYLGITGSNFNALFVGPSFLIGF